MRTPILTALTAVALLAGSPAAQAVDIVNEDESQHALTFTYAGDPDQETESLVVLPGSTVKQLCQGCRIMMGNGDTIDATHDEVVLIRDGKLQLAPKIN